MPTTILNSIMATKQLEIEQLLLTTNIKELENTLLYKRTCTPLTQLIKAKNGISIIAEYKRKSPSKGIINADANVLHTCTGYQAAGAVGVSILTDAQYFGGSNADVITVRNALTIPILRKEFIIHPIQVIQAKAIGADVILLIASCLTAKQVKELSSLAHSIGLQVILEVHTEQELEYITDDIEMVGINNRNLHNFTVKLEHSISMLLKIQPHKLVIAESGIANISDIVLLKKNGFNNFLIGEMLMKTNDPAYTLSTLLQQANAA